MYAFLVRLVIGWVVVAGVLVALAASTFVLALGLAALRADSGKESFGVAFNEALCDVTSSVANPAIIGLQGRFERRVSVADDGRIRFTSLPDHWKKICLTSFDSEIALPPDAIGYGRLLNMRSGLCRGWSPHTVTVLLIENANDTYLVQMKVPHTVGTRAVLTNYTDVQVPSDFSLCASRGDATAECVVSSFDGGGCIYLFRAR